MQVTQFMDTVAAEADRLVSKLNPETMTEAQRAEAITRTGQVIIMATLREIAETDPVESDRFARELYAALKAEEAGAQ